MPHLDAFLQRIWYDGSAAYRFLLPLSWLFLGLVALRRKAYDAGLLEVVRIGVPVVVVGNITVGGTGKTPVTIWLASELRRRGLRPGIVSRGYGGRGLGRRPLQVADDSDPALVGDEALLMARRSACPVAVHRDRVRASTLLQDAGVDVIIADDGLQHYRLDRQYEIVVIDGRRGFGNRRALPAGPLRESLARLATVDRVLINRTVLRSDAVMRALPPGLPVTEFYLKGTSARRLDDSASVPLSAFAGKTVHGVAAIGNPGRFFTFLESHGMQVVAHALPDHATPSARDLEYGDGLDVLITEKDAVKCKHLRIDRCWYVPVEVALEQPENWLDDLQTKLSVNV